MEKPKLKAIVRHLQTDQVLARYSITRNTLHRWMRDTALDFPAPTKIRNRNYFNEADLDAWDVKRGYVDRGQPETVEGNAVISGVIQTYQQFVEAMVARRQSLKLTCLEVDMKSGMQDSYTNKLENPNKKYGRGVGPDTLPLWLGGLRVGIVLVDLPRRPYVNRQDQDRLPV